MRFLRELKVERILGQHKLASRSELVDEVVEGGNALLESLSLSDGLNELATLG